VLHVVTVASVTALGVATPLGALYPVAVVLVALLLAYEQSLVSVDDLSRVKQAFDLNGYVGILYLLVTAASLYVG
jgi:4-hydroxybenzoate polyprenyltransferase